MAINIPSPQQQEKAQLRPAPNTRVQAGQAPQLGTGFLDTLSKRVNTQTEAELKRKAINDKFLEKEYDIQASKSTIEAKSTMTNMQGEMAPKKQLEIQQGLEKNLADLLNSERFQNADPALKLKMEQSARARVVDFQRVAIPHTEKQVRVLREKTFDQHSLNMGDLAVEYSFDTKLFATAGLSTVEESARQSMALKLGVVTSENQPLVDAAAAKMVSKSILGAANLHASYGNVEHVKDLLAEFPEGEGGKYKILPEDRAKINKILAKAVDENSQDLSFQFATDAMKMHPDDELAQYQAAVGMVPNDMPNKDKVINGIRTNITSMNAMNRRREKDAEDQIMVNAYNLAGDKIKKREMFTEQELRNMKVPPEKRNALKKYVANAGEVQTDADFFNAQFDRYLKDDPNFTEFKPASHFTKLSGSDIRFFQNLQKGIKTQGDSQRERIRGRADKVASGLVDTWLESKGLIDAQSKFKARKMSLDIVSELTEQGLTDETEIRKKIWKRLNTDKSLTTVTPPTSFLGFEFGGGEELNVEGAAPQETVGEEAQAQEKPDSVSQKAGGNFGAHSSWVNAILTQDPDASGEKIRKILDTALRQNFDVTKPYTGK
jgi:hypothetical protein